MIIELEDKLLSFIDSRIAEASDDELFAGGYLRGHISLSVATCEELGETQKAQLVERVDSSLDAAKSELTPADRLIVQDLWNELQNLPD
jgi:hypothetical protein